MDSGEAPLVAEGAGHGVILQPMELLRAGIASSQAYLFHSCRGITYPRGNCVSFTLPIGMSHPNFAVFTLPQQNSAIDSLRKPSALAGVMTFMLIPSTGS